MKALFLVCGEGLGHSTRSHAAANALKHTKWKVVVGSYGKSKTYFDQAGFDTIEIPSELTLVGRNGAIDLAESVKETLKANHVFSFAKLSRLLQREKPDLIVSDSYFMGILAAKFETIPSILLLNQTQVTKRFIENEGISLKLVGKAVKGLTLVVLKSATAICVPDFPEPFTVCTENLGKSKSFFPEKTHYLGPFVRTLPSAAKPAKTKKPLVYCAVGAFGYREKVFHKVIVAARNLPKINFVLSTGPNIDPRKFRAPKNVQVTFDYNPFPLLKACNLVITHGGHSTLMEAAAYGKPVISFPDIGHPEQQNNADGVEKIGFGKKAGYDMHAVMLEDLIVELSHDKRAKQKAQKLQKYAAHLKPAQAFAELCEKIVQEKRAISEKERARVLA